VPCRPVTPSRSRLRAESTASLASVVTTDRADGLRWRRPHLLASPPPPKRPVGAQHAPAFSLPPRRPWGGGGAGSRTRRVPPGRRRRRVRSPWISPRYSSCAESTFLLLPYCEISRGSGGGCKLATSLALGVHGKRQLNVRGFVVSLHRNLYLFCASGATATEFRFCELRLSVHG
jgi:hypothetical protein